MASSVHERSVMDVFKPDFSKGFDSLLLDCRFFLFYIYIYIILLSIFSWRKIGETRITGI